MAWEEWEQPRILWEASETDRIVARALRVLVKNKYDFTNTGATSVKEADREQGEADAKEQRDNPGFTETFATGLGAEGTLQFWRDLAAPPGGAVEGDKGTMLADVQNNLSMAPANASHGDSPAMEAAQGQVRRGLPERLRTGRGEYEREYSGDPGVAWRDTTDWDYPPTGNANDPLSGFMDTLGHNPTASLDFFNASTGQGDDKMSNFDYLAGHESGARKWPEDDDGKPIGYDNLGHALESVALGYAYDDPNPQIPPMKTEQQIAAREAHPDFVSDVMGNYKTPDIIDAQPGVRDSLAKIAGGNMDSLNHSMVDWGGSGELADRDGLFNADAQHLRDLDSSDTTNFPRALASDEDSYATVSSAQQVYGASLMAEALEKQTEWRRFAAGSAIGVGVGAWPPEWSSPPGWRQPWRYPSASRRWAQPARRSWKPTPLTASRRTSTRTTRNRSIRFRMQRIRGSATPYTDNSRG
ncbi:hypothetical protein [Streptomyces sp. NPDC059906]|uniref:hypothetical protein n=1 Tax=Streptomyces sp. NPDC059906 TaxID=3346997 RepID=UPI0036550DEA